jgi:hypothetical protein
MVTGVGYRGVSDGWLVKAYALAQHYLGLDRARTPLRPGTC